MNFKKAKVITKETDKAKIEVLNDGQFSDWACQDRVYKNPVVQGDCACEVYNG
jgi:hypothetical protein